MRFWTREVAGWLLVGVGLFLAFKVVSLLGTTHNGQPAPRLLEAGPLSFLAFIIFRGGIHLLKVAVAARVCLLAQEKARPERARSVSAKPLTPSRPT